MPTESYGARAQRLFVALLPVLGALSCARAQESAPNPAAGAAIPASAAAASASTGAQPPPRPAASTPDDDEVRPVYPMSGDPPEPLAVRLCDALHALPALRKAACCGVAPGVALASECARTLSFALRSSAVTLAPADVDACVAASEGAVAGCDWVTPLSPPVPASCEGIVRGTLKEGARCRSSLECVDGLRCAGAGPTEAGRCEPPRRGGACGASVDVLAAHTRQSHYERAHPECSGHCAGRVCAADVPSGGRCRSHVECGRDRRCVAGSCSGSPLPPAGAPCLGGLCADGARCVNGRCAAPKAEGEACANDAECRAACVRQDAGPGGVCGRKCAGL